MKARLLLAAAASALLCAPAQAAPPGSTFLVTRPTGFGPLTVGFTNDSWTGTSPGDPADRGGRRTASANGRFVVFVSEADGLSTDDVDAFPNVFVRDVVTGTTTLASRGPGVLGPAANGESGDPSISGNGEWVAFESRATNLSDADEGGAAHVFKRNLVTGETVLVDRADGPAGAIANDSAGSASISEDGSAVAFASPATNLGSASGVMQVYVREGTSTEVASRLDASNTNGAESSRAPSISADGTRVAFTSDEELVSGTDTNAFSDVYVRVLGTMTTVLVSRQSSADGALVGNANSHSPAIASDDHPTNPWRVAFTSEATNLAGSADAVGDPDAYVRTSSSVTQLVSRADGATGVKGSHPSIQPSISDDGTRVGFVSSSTNLEPIDTNGVSDVFVRSLGDGPPGDQNATTLGSRGVGNAIGDSSSFGGAIGPSGTRVYFESEADNFHPDDDNDFVQVFSRFLGLTITEPTIWISRPAAGGSFRSGTNDSTSRNLGRTSEGVTTVSADGRFVAFVSNADELSAEDDDRFMNAFVRDTLTGEIILVSRASGAGPAANGHSGPLGGGALSTGAEGAPPAISADGRRVAFSSFGSNLVPGDNNGTVDVFVRDLVTGVTELASRKEDDSVGSLGGFGSALSSDGTKVAFISQSQLVGADNNPFLDVYLRDLSAGTTTLISRQTGSGAVGNSHSREAAISADGSRVAFATSATNFAPSLVDGNGVSDVYLRDLGADTTRPVSVRNQALLKTGNGPSNGPAISADGMRVAFDSRSNDLAPGDLNGTDTDVFLRDLSAATTTLVSRGPGGVGGNQSSLRPAISADGNRVAFESFATDFSPLAVSPRTAVFLRDLAAGTTQLVSRGDGADGPGANDVSLNAAISANGNCVAFDSFADNLIPGGPAGTDFIRTYMRVISGECPNDPPETAIDSGPAGPTADSTPSFGFSSDEPGSSFACRVDAAGFAPCGSPFTLAVVGDGAHSFEARATDPAGNTDATPASRSFSVDTRRPNVRRLRVRPKRFEVTGRGSRGSATRPRRVVISFRLSEAARVTLSIERPRPGRRAGGRCRKPTPRLRSRPRCVRWVRVGRLRARAAKAGGNRVRFNGRVRRRALRPGPYRVTARAVDGVGNRSLPRSAPFRVVAGG